jgi:hypothetical protein
MRPMALILCELSHLSRDIIPAQPSDGTLTTSRHRQLGMVADDKTLLPSGKAEHLQPRTLHGFALYLEEQVPLTVEIILLVSKISAKSGVPLTVS